MSVRITPEQIGLTKESQQLLQELCPDPSADLFTYNVWKYMCMCFDTPRPSAKEELIRQKCIDVANLLGLKSGVDASGNLVITKPPTSPEYATRTSFIIQGHLDMVCTKNDGVTHNFDTDRINAQITADKVWIQSGETTLGCDNGIGVAYGLAALEDETLQHGWCYGLFTTEEETTMNGALNLDPELVRNPTTGRLPDTLLNVDSEDPRRLCVGCAGGSETTLSIPLDNTTTTTMTDAVLVNVDIKGLTGGHSGCDIHLGRAQAIKLFFTMLQMLSEKYNTAEQYQVAAYQMQSGTAPNVIPRSATAQLLVKKAIVNEVVEMVNVSIQNTFVAQYAAIETAVSNPELKDDVAKQQEVCQLRVTATATEEIDTTSSSYTCVNFKTQQNAVALGLAIKSGVLAFNKDIPTFVDTSNCFSLMKIDEKEIFYHTFARSTIDADLDNFHAELTALAQQYNAKVSEQFNGFPGWPVIADSKLLTAAQTAFKTSFGYDLPADDMYSIHAGLESGPLAKQLPTTHMVSLGPLIEMAHSPYERCKIDTVAECAVWLVNIIKTISAIDGAEFQ